jgi:hypothetical protein
LIQHDVSHWRFHDNSRINTDLWKFLITNFHHFHVLLNVVIATGYELTVAYTYSFYISNMIIQITTNSLQTGGRAFQHFLGLRNRMVKVPDLSVASYRKGLSGNVVSLHSSRTVSLNRYITPYTHCIHNLYLSVYIKICMIQLFGPL